MLGLFDSGLGGLTVLQRLHEKLPKHDILFFSDQLHVPYGEKSPAELVDLLRANAAFLDARGADAIVMACNTSCATAAREGWPHTRAAIVDLIDSAAIAVESAGFKHIGVIATTATTATRAYTQKIQARAPGAVVVEVAAPALVPLVEAGKLDGPEPRAAVEAVCAQLPRGLDAIVLACTHYPLLDAHFAAALGPRVARIDPANVQAERAAALAVAQGFAAGTGSITCITTGDPQRFRDAVSATLGPLPGLRFER
jgi:glutamate racemase